MKKTNLFQVAAVLLSVFVASCDTSYFDKDIEDFTWDGSAQVPIGHITYTVAQLFEELGSEDLVIGSDSENVVSFTYQKSITTSNNTNYDVTIADQTINATIETPITTQQFTNVGGSPYTIVGTVPADFITIDSKTEVHNLGLSQEMTSADFNKGTLVITINSQFDTTIDMTLTIPSLVSKIGGTPYSKTLNFTENETKVETVQLNLYTADFTHDGTASGTTTNKMTLSLGATFNFTAGDVLKDTDNISYVAIISNANTEIVRGDFKQESFNIDNESLNLDFFDNFGSGVLEFANPTLTLTASNSYGFPIGINLDAIEAINGNTSETLTYTGSTIPNTLIINPATYTAPNAVAVTTSKVVDNTNSNLADLLKIKPTRFNLNISGNSNPVDAAPNLNFYAKNNSGLTADITLEVPLDVKFQNIALEQIVEFDNADDLDDLNEVVLKLTTENLIPLTGNIEMTFYNNNTLLNVSKTVVAFDAADDFDANGRVATAKIKSSSLSFDGTDITEVQKATKIKLIFTLDTPTNGAVKLFDDYTLKASIGAIVKAELKSDDN